MDAVARRNPQDALELSAGNQTLAVGVGDDGLEDMTGEVAPAPRQLPRQVVGECGSRASCCVGGSCGRSKNLLRRL